MDACNAVLEVLDGVLVLGEYHAGAEQVLRTDKGVKPLADLVAKAVHQPEGQGLVDALPHQPDDQIVDEHKHPHEADVAVLRVGGARAGGGVVAPGAEVANEVQRGHDARVVQVVAVVHGELDGGAVGLHQSLHVGHVLVGGGAGRNAASGSVGLCHAGADVGAHVLDRTVALNHRPAHDHVLVVHAGGALRGDGRGLGGGGAGVNVHDGNGAEHAVDAGGFLRHGGGDAGVVAVAGGDDHVGGHSQGSGAHLDGFQTGHDDGGGHGGGRHLLIGDVQGGGGVVGAAGQQGHIHGIVAEGDDVVRTLEQGSAAAAGGLNHQIGVVDGLNGQGGAVRHDVHVGGGLAGVRGGGVEHVHRDHGALRVLG